MFKIMRSYAASRFSKHSTITRKDEITVFARRFVDAQRVELSIELSLIDSN